MDKTFAGLLSSIEETRKNANISLEGRDPRTLVGAETLKNVATAALPGLIAQYSAAIRVRAVGFLPTGPEDLVEQFAKIALDEGQTLTVAPLALAGRLADVVEPALGSGRQFTSSELMLVVSEIRAIEKEIDYEGPPVRLDGLPGITYVTNHEASVAFIWQLLWQSGNGPFVIEYARFLVTQAALKACYNSFVVPVVVVGLAPQEAGLLGAGVFGTKFVVVPLDGDPTTPVVVDREFVLKTFTQAKRRFIAKKN